VIKQLLASRFRFRDDRRAINLDPELIHSSLSFAIYVSVHHASRAHTRSTRSV
jgi:hypothetical protein